MKTKYKNEDDLLQLVLGKMLGHSIPDKCDYAILFVKNDIYINITKLTIRIIKLLWADGILNLRKYLSENKQMIIHQLYEMYTQPLTSVVLASELSKINRYGIIIRMFQSSNMKKHEYIYDFFDLLINEKKVKEIINKYLNFSINRRIMSNIKVDELINFINESKCFVRNKFNLYKLYKYIDMKEKMNVFQKENINKP